MIFSLFGIQFHLLELLTLVILTISFPARLAFFGTKIVLAKKLFLYIYIYSFLFFLISIVLSSTNALDHSLVLKAFIKWLEVLLLSLLIFFFTSDEEKFKKIYWLLLISCIGIVIIRYFEILIGKYGLFQYRILPGYEAAFSFALLLPLIKEKKKYIYFLISLSIVSLILSLSRGAWIASFICAIYFLQKSKPKLRAVFVLIFISIVLVVNYLYHINPIIEAKLTSTFLKTSASNLERLNMILISIEAFLTHPFLGIGASNFSTFLIHHGLSKFVVAKNIEALTPHNFFLQVAAEQGLIGIFAFSIILFVVYRILFTNNSFREMINKLHYIQGLQLFFIAFVVSLMLGYISGPFRFFFGVFSGLSLSLLRLYSHSANIQKRNILTEK